MDTQSKLIQAIKNRQAISFLYENEIRIVSPHVLGVSKNNKKLLGSTFMAGYSESNDISDYRTYDIAKITNIENSDMKYKISKGYNSNNPMRGCKILISI